jgi:hypothetical protein
MYLHLIHKALNLSTVDPPSMSFLRNITPLLDKGLLYKNTVKNINDV